MGRMNENECIMVTVLGIAVCVTTLLIASMVSDIQVNNKAMELGYQQGDYGRWVKSPEKIQAEVDKEPKIK